MKKNKGFTLIEVLVTTAVLAFGIVSIFQAMFMIMSAFSYIAHYLAVIPHVDEKVWEAQDAVMRLGPKAGLAPQGSFGSGGKRYDWTLSAALQDASAGLYRIELVTQWDEGRKHYRLARSALVIREPEDEEK